MDSIRLSSAVGDLPFDRPFDTRETLGEDQFSVPSDAAEIQGCFVNPDGLHIHVTVKVEDPKAQAAGDVAADIIDIVGRYVQDVASVTSNQEGF